MKVDVAFYPEEFGEKIKKAGIVAVIDVLRASSSIITALANGAEAVIPAASKEEALAVRRKNPGKAILLCGERNGLRIPGFDLGNSPEEYARAAVGGKTLIFASTNGSKLMVKTVRAGRPLFIAGFININAVIGTMAASGENCLIACAGREGRYSLEDTVAAGMLAEGIGRAGSKAASFSDEARTAMILYRHFADDLAGMAGGSLHGRYLTGLGLGRDIAFCASLDRFDVVPVFNRGALRPLRPRGKKKNGR
jgi:2-phosphosulfolactate phosphatase